MGYRDKAGSFYVVDRAKDVIIKGGITIASCEVEEALLTHPGVAEAAVIGVPDPIKGESIKAYILAHSGQRVTQKDLLTHLRERVASYKVPALMR